MKPLNMIDQPLPRPAEHQQMVGAHAQSQRQADGKHRQIDQ